MGEANFYYFTCLKFRYLSSFRLNINTIKMSSVKDVDQQKFVVGFADFLKKSGKMKVPGGSRLLHQDLRRQKAQRNRPQPLHESFPIRLSTRLAGVGRDGFGREGRQRWTQIDV